LPTRQSGTPLKSQDLGKTLEADTDYFAVDQQSQATVFFLRLSNLFRSFFKSLSFTRFIISQYHQFQKLTFLAIKIPPQKTNIKNITKKSTT